MNERRSFFNTGALILLAASALLLLPWLGETLFNSKGEPREAIVGMTILEQGNWILPVNYGTDIPFKPPFLGWLIAIFAWLFNGGEVNEYISRLPSALAAIAMVMGGFYCVRRVRGDAFALIFGIMTLTVTEVFRSAVACRLDMVLTACMVGGLYWLYTLYEGPLRRRWPGFIGVILLFTCAVMTKGPVGSFLPCFAMGIYLLIRGHKFWRTLGAMLGIAVAALILPAWWCWEAYKIGGQPFLDLMWEENFGRLLGTMSYESHVKPFYYNFMTLAAGLLPWLLVFVFSLFTWRRFRTAISGILTPFALLSLVTAVVVIGFYCIPDSKRSVYLLPAYPFICYGLTHLLTSRELLSPVRVFAWIMAILGVIVPIAGLVLTNLQLPGLPEFAAVPWWGYVICAIPVFVSICWIFSRKFVVVEPVTLIIWSLFLCYAAVFMPAVLNPQSDAKLLPSIVHAPNVVTYDRDGKYRLFTLNFYMRDRLRSVRDISELGKSPKGTVLIAPAESDTSGWSANFTVAPLTERGCDFRGPLIIATKK